MTFRPLLSYGIDGLEQFVRSNPYSLERMDVVLQELLLRKTDTYPKLKPRWNVHLSGDDDQLGCAGEFLSSVLGE